MKPRRMSRSQSQLYVFPHGIKKEPNKWVHHVQIDLNWSLDYLRSDAGVNLSRNEERMNLGLEEIDTDLEIT